MPTDVQRLATPHRSDRTDPGQRTLHQWIEAQVARSPDATALVFEGESVSYGEMNARANRLARALRRRGVGPDALVGIVLDRSIEMMVGLLGVLKAGGAYVPIDPAYPPARIAFMLRDADPTLVLSQERHREALEGLGIRPLCLDGDWERTEPDDDPPAASPTGPEHLAYVIYTSGSTGQPKGAMNEHRAVVNRLRWMQDTFAIGPGDTVLQKTPISFDVSVWELFWPLMVGARLAIARPEGHKDAHYLAGTIRAYGVTVIHFVPSMLYLFLEERDLRERCRSLRAVVCSGEALPFDLQERFFATLDAELHNLYGPTEAAVDVTHWRCRRDDPEGVVPIGYPVANTQIHLLDEAMSPVPDGEVGELVIGGAQVARGYLGHPEMTRERFVDDPFRDAEGARLYRTGDLAQRRPDGAILFLGRSDHQIKLRGFRIELGEVESALNRHPAVRRSVVVAREDRPGDRRLVGYVVADDEIDRGAAIAHLSEILPDYMIPSVFVRLDALPLSPNGKIDRAALPAPERSRPDLDQPYAPPRDELERHLCALWADLLGLDRVGRNDRFFELGGTSLQAAQLTNRLQKEFDAFIYVVALFGAPSVAEYGALLRRDYAQVVSDRFGVGPSVGAAERPSVATLTEADFERFRTAIPRLAELPPAEPEPNPPAIFVLAPPRSGTTLLRVMLAGHPELFAAAELLLLNFATLGERRAAFSGRFSGWLEGTLRAAMELRGVDAEGAKEIEAGFDDATSTAVYYRELQRWTDGRTLVDKTPHYALDPLALRRAERDVSQARYIHLSRHPRAAVRSFENYHMDQVLYMHDHAFSARQLGELVWAESHRSILTFLDDVPAERQVHVTYEALVRSPEATMRRLCAEIDLPYHEALVTPYQGIDQKMTDGLYAESTPMGDTHLLEYAGIDPSAADRWRDDDTPDFLSDVAWRVAERLGYRREGAAAPQGRRSAQERQRRLRQSRRRRGA